MSESKAELDALIEREKREVALEHHHDAWAGGLSDGIEAEIMAEAAIETALVEFVEAAGEEAALASIDSLRERLHAGAFTPKTVH